MASLLGELGNTLLCDESLCLLIPGHVQDEENPYKYDHTNCEIEMPVCPSF